MSTFLVTFEVTVRTADIDDVLRWAEKVAEGDCDIGVVDSFSAEEKAKE